MSIVHDTGVYFDPYDVGINADPYPTYTRLRDEAPIYHNERFDFWALSRHADVEKAARQLADVLEHPQRHPRHHPAPDVELPPGVILFEDPPLHGMHRGLMSRVFTPRRDGRARRPGTRVLRRHPRPARRLRWLRHHHRARVGDADARHRHAAGHPRRRPDRGAREDRRRPAHQARRADAGAKERSPTATCSPSTSTGAPSTRPTT